MGIYYNRDLADTIPTLWEILPDILKDSTTEDADVFDIKT
jgi:hypothetical protein